MTTATPTPPVFEIYETGDPYSHAWDATEYRDATSRESGVGFYRGDLGHTYTKAGLVRHLRRTYPGCLIYSRDSGRRIP